MVNKDSKIAIIGGGISGFASGLSLIKNGYKNVVVFERDLTASQRRQGYGLTILQGISALKKLDVYSDVYNIDTPSRSHFIFDSKGNLLGFFGTIFWPSSSSNESSNSKKSKKHNLHLSRQDLRSILMNKYLSLHPDKSNAIKWNKKLLNLKQLNSNEYDLEFNDDFSYKANLVIGCDGINSMTRKYKYPVDLPLNYLGILLVLGISRTKHQLGNQRVFQTVDGTTRLFAMPFSHDESKNIMWQLSLPLDETTAKFFSKDTQALKSFLLEKCGDWHEPIPQMIEATELDMLMGIPAFDRDLMPVKPNDTIALLGDAAHPMSPFKGQGANQALIDACELTESLNKYDDLSQAVYEFESKMTKRVLSKVMASRERVTTYHQANILNVENFFHRGVNEKLLETLKMKGINAQTESIEDVIIKEMKELNFFDQTNENQDLFS